MGLHQIIEDTGAEFEEKFVGERSDGEPCLLAMEDKIEGIKSFLHSSQLAIIEEVVRMAEEIKNFRQAKIDRNYEWNNALEQSARYYGARGGRKKKKEPINEPNESNGI